MVWLLSAIAAAAALEARRGPQASLVSDGRAEAAWLAEKLPASFWGEIRAWVVKKGVSIHIQSSPSEVKVQVYVPSLEGPAWAGFISFEPRSPTAICQEPGPSPIPCPAPGETSDIEVIAGRKMDSIWCCQAAVLTPNLQGKGIGLLMYLVAIARLGVDGGNFVGPDKVTGGSSSRAAARVWSTLSTLFPASQGILYAAPLSDSSDGVLGSAMVRP